MVQEMMALVVMDTLAAKGVSVAVEVVTNQAAIAEIVAFLLGVLMAAMKMVALVALAMVTQVVMV